MRYRFLSQTRESFPSNPEKVGTGVWFFLHLKSRHANDDASIQDFLKDFELTIKHFPCLKCRKHAYEYIRDNNPLTYVNYTYDDGQGPVRLGMFRYIWEFHNTVNSKSGKPLISWEDALKIFSSPENICTHCDADKEGFDLLMLPGFVVVNKNTVYNNNITPDHGNHNTQGQQPSHQQSQGQHYQSQYPSQYRHPHQSYSFQHQHQNNQYVNKGTTDNIRYV